MINSTAMLSLILQLLLFMNQNLIVLSVITNYFAL